MAPVLNLLTISVQGSTSSIGIGSKLENSKRPLIVFGQGIRTANAISEFGEDAADSADDVSQGIGDAIENLSETIKNSAGNIKDSMVSIAKGIGESIKALLQGIGEGLGAMLQGMARGLEALAAPKVIIGGLVLMGIVFAVAALVYAFSQLFGVFAASIDIMPTLFLYFLAFLR